jgi:hypothetical protein
MMNKFDKLTRPWEIWLVHHTHVDIGYTEPQDIILRKHAEFIAQVLDFCTATDALPAGERFCWTCEVAWTIKAFLARYPERSEEFFRRVREGRIEVTALYLQLTDLFTQELLEDTTDYAFDLARQYDFNIVTAMNDDVNGWAWGLPDLLSRRGVRYMDTAINETRALGVRPRPAIFKWTGPENGSVSLWHSNGYLTGNGLAFDQPESDERVINFLAGLEESGYPHNVIEVRIHGENHDNAPPGLWISDTIHRWNAEHQSGPKLRMVTPREWFEEVDKNWSSPIIEHCAGWPDWWADGNGTAAYESLLVRKAQADLTVLKSLSEATGVVPMADRVNRAREAAAFFCEHTWGAWCSTDDPESLTSRSQWNIKSGFAYTAAVEAGSLLKDTLDAAVKNNETTSPAIMVFNPSDETRSDIVEILIADDDIGLNTAPWVPGPIRSEDGPAFHLIDADNGNAVAISRQPTIADSARRPAQMIKFLAANVPTKGFKRYEVKAGDITCKSTCSFDGKNFVNTNYEIELSADSTGIASIRDRKTGNKLIQTDAEFNFGDVIYEMIPGPFGREKLCGWDGIKRDCNFERKKIKFNKAELIKLPYGMKLQFEAINMPGSLQSLTLGIIIYDNLPRIDLQYKVNKNSNPEAEALYVAFPLAGGENSETWLDLPGASMRPGIDQVPGTATDWHSIQHYFAVSGNKQTVVIASPDIPLVQVNGINTGKWQQTLPPGNGVVMSWVMNNYWFTNFPAAQGGSFAWNYSLTSFPGFFNKRETDSFARGIRQPLVATLLKC